MSSLPAPAGRIRIRQIAICTPDIWPVETALTQALKVTPVHRDKPGPPIWMFNGVIPIGDTFLEILQPERPEAPTQKFLEKQGGAGGYMLLLQVDDLDRARARSEAAGVRTVLEMPRRDYHGVKGAAIHLHPADTGGVLTSFDWMENWDDWAWAGPAWPWHQRTEVVAKIVAAEIACRDPAAVADRFAEFVGRPADADHSITLDEGSLRFVQAPEKQRDRLTAIDMAASDRTRAGESFEFARTRVNLV